jgi:polyhydroxybutyrate depolymerase
VTIDGGGHWWPGADLSPGIPPPTDTIDASAMIWAFFEVHSLP